MTYTFARVGAVVAIAVEDYFHQKNAGGCACAKKNGRLNEIPCHHSLGDYLDAYIEAADIGGDHKGPPLRSAVGKTGQLSEKAMTHGDVWRMVRRRATDAGIETPVGATPSAPVPGITDYLKKAGTRRCATYGRTLERQNDGPLRPAQG